MKQRGGLTFSVSAFSLLWVHFNLKAFRIIPLTCQILPQGERGKLIVRSYGGDGLGLTPLALRGSWQSYRGRGRRILHILTGFTF